MTSNDALFVNLVNQQNIFKTMENFIFLTINKCLGNFAYKDKIVMKYSIQLIKSIVLKLKVKLTKEIFNDLSVSRHISQELLKINDSSLGDPTYYKLRSELYEVIAICYLNDSYKDYIPNIHLILGQIMDTNMRGENLKVGPLYARQTSFEFSEMLLESLDRLSRAGFSSFFVRLATYGFRNSSTNAGLSSSAARISSYAY